MHDHYAELQTKMNIILYGKSSIQNIYNKGKSFSFAAARTSSVVYPTQYIMHLFNIYIIKILFYETIFFSPFI